MPDKEPTAPVKRRQLVPSIAYEVSRLPNGDRARLRRIFLTQAADANGVVAGLLHRAGVDLPVGPATFERWRLLAHVAALLSGTAAHNAHDSKRCLGRRLREIGYSEERLLRLTAARGLGLHAQIIRVARTLAQARIPSIDLYVLYDLTSFDPERAESARLRIAQDYYAAAARSEGDSK